MLLQPWLGKWVTRFAWHWRQVERPRDFKRSRCGEPCGKWQVMQFPPEPIPPCENRWGPTKLGWHLAHVLSSSLLSIASWFPVPWGLWQSMQETFPRVRERNGSKPDFRNGWRLLLLNSRSTRLWQLKHWSSAGFFSIGLAVDLWIEWHVVQESPAEACREKTNRGHWLVIACGGTQGRIE